MGDDLSPERKQELEQLAEADLGWIIPIGFLFAPAAYLMVGKTRTALFNLLTLNWFLTGMITAPLHLWKLITNARDELEGADTVEPESSAESGSRDGADGEPMGRRENKVTGDVTAAGLESGEDEEGEVIEPAEGTWRDRLGVTRRRAMIGVAGFVGASACLAAIPPEETEDGAGPGEAEGDEGEDQAEASVTPSEEKEESESEPEETEEPETEPEEEEDESESEPEEEDDEGMSALQVEWARRIEQAHGIDVLDISGSSDHSWFFYYQTAGRNNADDYELGAVADGYAWLVDEHPSEAPDDLIVYAIGDPDADPLSDGAVGGFYVEREWAEDWLNGLMTDDEYAMMVMATYEEDPP